MTAHIAVKGLGEIGNGALHPFVTPAHALALLAAALLLGQGRPFRMNQPMAAVAAAAIVGLCIAAVQEPGWLPAAVPLVAAIVVAAVVAAEKSGNLLLRSVCAASCALAVALDSSPDGLSGTAALPALLGTWLGICAGIGYFAICFSHADTRPWARVALRVAASWIVAISLLVLAFEFKR